MSSEEAPAALYNSPLETGLRALAILDAFYPRELDLTELTWFDHLVVHTADVGGPSSLHPDLAPRTGEMYVRRRLVEDSLSLMRQVDLVDIRADGDGVRYLSSDEAPAFLEMLEAPYSVALKMRARWLNERFGGLPRDEVEALVKERIGRWTAEFQSSGQPEDNRS